MITDLIWMTFWLIVFATAEAVLVDDERYIQRAAPWTRLWRVALIVSAAVLAMAILNGCAEETAPVQFDVAGPDGCKVLVSWHDTTVRRGGVNGLPWESPEFEAPVGSRPELTVWNYELCDGVNIGARVSGEPVIVGANERGESIRRQPVGILATLRVEV